MGEDQQSTVQSSQSTEQAPLLSVTVLNYNYARYLPQCLDSILRQSFTDFELLLINDCSTDNSLDVIQPYLADPRVKLINHERNTGYISSLIEGSDRSRGKYLTVISADDYCRSDRAFETLLKPMEADPSVAYSFSAYGMYGDDGVLFYLNRPFIDSWVRSGADMYGELIRRVEVVLHTGTIIRSTAYRAVGGYNPQAKYSIDQVMWLMLCSAGKVAYSADELYVYRRHGGNMSESFSVAHDSLKDALLGVQLSFPSMAKTGEVAPQLYKVGIKRRLSATTERALFAGNYVGALFSFWTAFQMHPWLTVFQSRTLVILARALLGQRGYDYARRRLRPLAGGALSNDLASQIASQH